MIHNLHHAMASYQPGEASSPDWAIRFEQLWRAQLKSMTRIFGSSS